MNGYEPADPMKDVWRQGFWSGVILTTIAAAGTFLLLIWLWSM